MIAIYGAQISLALSFNYCPRSQDSVDAMASHGVTNPSSFMGDYAYVTPHMRFQPFLLGILFAYYLHKTKAKQIKLSKMLQVVFWFISFLIGASVIGGSYSVRINGYSRMETSLYWGFSKAGWCLALSWIMFACIHGYGGLVNRFLSNRLFMVLSKLTYLMYLLHLDIVHLVWFSMNLDPVKEPIGTMVILPMFDILKPFIVMFTFRCLIS